MMVLQYLFFGSLFGFTVFEYGTMFMAISGGASAEQGIVKGLHIVLWVVLASHGHRYFEMPRQKSFFFN